MAGQNIGNHISTTLCYIDDVAARCQTVSSRDPHSLPSWFSNSRELIGLVRQIFEIVEDRRKANILDLDDGGVKDLESAGAAAKNLSAIFRAVSSPAEAEISGRCENFLQKPGENEIKVAMLWLLQGVHKLVDTRITPPLIDPVHQLEDAIKSLKPPKPMGETAGGNHYGTGDNFNNSGNGHQNINKDNGTQYNSGSMNWADRSNP